MLTGSCEHSIDAKGRVIIPAKFRQELGESFYVSKGINGCLFAQSQEQWTSFVSKFADKPMAESAVLMRFFCSGAEAVTVNGQGRILIPEHLRKYAHLEKEVTIVGIGLRAEIWDTETWKKYSEENVSEEIVLDELKKLDI